MKNENNENETDAVGGGIFRSVLRRISQLAGKASIGQLPKKLPLKQVVKSAERLGDLIEIGDQIGKQRPRTTASIQHDDSSNKPNNSKLARGIVHGAHAISGFVKSSVLGGVLFYTYDYLQDLLKLSVAKGGNVSPSTVWIGTSASVIGAIGGLAHATTSLTWDTLSRHMTQVLLTTTHQTPSTNNTNPHLHPPQTKASTQRTTTHSYHFNKSRTRVWAMLSPLKSAAVAAAAANGTAMAPSVPGTVLAHVAVHATLFGVYETVKDLGMKNLPPASIPPLSQMQPQTRTIDTSKTVDGSTGGGNSTDDTDGDLDLDVALALMPTTASGRLAAEAVVVAVSGGIAGAIGEVVQHCIQPLEDMVKGQQMGPSLREAKTRLYSLYRTNASGGGLSLRSVAGAAIPSALGFLAYELGKRF